MADYRLSARAEADLMDLLAYSDRQFGEAACRRYERLVLTALEDIAQDPDRLGVRVHLDLGDGIRIYPLVHSRRRARTAEGLVKTPRHIVIFRVLAADLIAVVRILHENMDIEFQVALDNE